MEHRWGQRIAVDFPIRWGIQPFLPRRGRLTNLSLSGGFLHTAVALRVLAQIQIVIDFSLRPRHDAPVIAAYVTRLNEEGFGIEWCEFAPRTIIEILHVGTARPDMLIRKGSRADSHPRSHLS
jgi:hypothetical protein